MQTWDAVVVGAGPAGCAAAYDLVTAGKRVLLLDKALFPRHKLCAGGLTIKSLQRLRYSVAPVVHHASARMGVGHAYQQRVEFQTAAPVCALVERSEFDAYCFTKTCAAGAHFDQIVGVSDVIETADEVVLTLTDGRQLHTRYLLAADGAHSPLRKLLGANKPHMAVGLEALVPRESCSNEAIFRFDFGVIGQGYGWVFPKRDHYNVGLYTRKPDLYPLAKAALRDYVGFTLGSEALVDLRGFPIPTGAGVQPEGYQRCFLIGDAGGYAEQLLGEGIHNAIASGQNAALALLNAQGGPALSAFRTAQQPLQNDILRCTMAARCFYGLLPIGFRLLQVPPVREALMQGFAGGRNLSQCVKALLKWRPDCSPAKSLTLLDQPFIPVD